jgi:hypothetical protein
LTLRRLGGEVISTGNSLRVADRAFCTSG